MEITGISANPPHIQSRDTVPDDRQEAVREVKKNDTPATEENQANVGQLVDLTA